MPTNSTEATKTFAQRGSATNRSVSVVYERGEWYVRSEDGDVGGIFISQDAAMRYVDRELCREQGRPLSLPNEGTASYARRT